MLYKHQLDHVSVNRERISFLSTFTVTQVLFCQYIITIRVSQRYSKLLECHRDIPNYQSVIEILQTIRVSQRYSKRIRVSQRYSKLLECHRDTPNYQSVIEILQTIRVSQRYSKLLECHRNTPNYQITLIFIVFVDEFSFVIYVQYVCV